MTEANWTDDPMKAWDSLSEAEAGEVADRAAEHLYVACAAVNFRGLWLVKRNDLRAYLTDVGEASAWPLELGGK